jgi:poly(3-hydroxyalkanoate) depolymerase
MNQQFNIRTIDLNGQKIRTGVRPGKQHLTPLLIFNGIGASMELVLPFVEQLHPDQEVIAFDVPGVGGSPRPKFPYSFDGMARTVARMLDALNYEKVCVLGVSWGGFLAQQFARQYPERCKKLILAATSCGIGMVMPSPKVLTLMASPLRYTNPEHMAKIAPDIYGGVFRRDKELCLAYASKMKANSSALGYYYQTTAVYFWSSMLWLHELTQPTLVLAGSDDPIIPLFNMKFIANQIPHAELHVFDDGHLFIVTVAEATAKLVNRFLNEEKHKAVAHPRKKENSELEKA